MSELSEKQREFPLMVAALLTWAYEHGYEFTFGECYRTPEQAALNAAGGKGIANSLHTQRLAIDLNLFINDVYQTDSAAHRPIAEKWKTLHKDACWGGDFSHPDGNHYSLSYQGIK